MKHTITIAVLVLLFIGLTGYAIHSYKKPAPAVPSVPASKYNRLVDTLNVREAVDDKNLQNAQAQVSTLTEQKANLCGQVKAAKLTNPLCQ